jgi:hypothetical protein
MIRKLGTIGVCAIILLDSTAVSASAKGASGSSSSASHAGHAGHGGTSGHAPGAGFVYDKTAPPGSVCQPGVCLKSAP